MNELNLFLEKLAESYANNSFVKITLSKPAYKSDGLLNVYIRLVSIKNELVFSFTYHYQTNDQVKNYTLEETNAELMELLTNKFKIARLFTLKEDVVLQFSKKGKGSLKTLPPSFENKPPETHDVPKKKRAALGKYLNVLGIADENGQVFPKMAGKFKQINKYLEIVENLLKDNQFNEPIRIVDMGSGKGYLTFALYDFMKNQLKLNVEIKGIEIRQELVDFCNDAAEKCGFEQLSFEKSTIQDLKEDKIDILIALHACDTATDDAIFKGVSAKAALIICAPCCHKELRQASKGKEIANPLLKHGIFKERQYEMITDAMRALIMEKQQYNTKIFEFISNEHTRKNIMLVASKSNKKPMVDKIDEEINTIKKEFNIDQHYLESLLD
ncbi:MAG: SAM-dependent methyltransferase [Vicingaceae bacterium]|nr:SAM-dependent methyltransferase [Vicingaceae bacterium]|tara:strand:- start:18460 stop:19614 length:1155 start_codon:yes stop_codon:yes gene_type:complete